MDPIFGSCHPVEYYLPVCILVHLSVRCPILYVPNRGFLSWNRLVHQFFVRMVNLPACLQRVNPFCILSEYILKFVILHQQNYKGLEIKQHGNMMVLLRRETTFIYTLNISYRELNGINTPHCASANNYCKYIILCILCNALLST